MKPLRSSFILACLTAVFGAANAQPSSTANADSHYVGRTSDRYLAFAGSNANFEALAVGLRHGSSVTLEGTQRVYFMPPTRPMGYGNITRAIDLASRQLAAAAITEPTPAQIKAAMMGGEVTASNGGVTLLQGVLQLRSQGMGWGQIAHAVGVHPGLRSGSVATKGTPAAAGITTAAGSSVSVSGAKLKSAHSASNGLGRSGIVTGAGGASAAGGGNAFGQGHGNAFGQGHGNAFGRGGKP